MVVEAETPESFVEAREKTFPDSSRTGRPPQLSPIDPMAAEPPQRGLLMDKGKCIKENG
jgi:hypothetical protein